MDADTDNDVYTYKIKLTEVETLSISSQISSKFCISYSGDDKIAILIDGDVFIYELWPTSSNDSQSMAFLKYCIPSAAMTPMEVNFKKYKEFLWNLNKNDAFKVALDSTLSNTNDRPDSLSNSHIVQCEFSSVINNESYISCLSNNGTLQIFKKAHKNWISVINVSKLWVSHCNIDINDFDIDFEGFKNKMQHLKIIGMKWALEFHLRFYTFHLSGIMCIWKVSVDKCLSMSADKSINLNFPCQTLDLVSISGSFTANILIAGSVSGLVKAFLVDLNSGFIHQGIDLWPHKDLIGVNMVKTKILSNEVLVLVVKRYALILFMLKVINPGELKLLKTEITEFPAEISSVLEFENTYVVCLLNHTLHVLNINYNDLSCNLYIIDTGLKSKQKNSYHCYGITWSKNQAIWMMVSSAKINYDSLKEITLINIFTPNEKKFKNLSDFTCCGLIEKIMKTHNEIKMCDITDILELKRLELLMDDSKFRATYEASDSMFLLELKLLLWEAKLKQHCNSSETDIGVNHLEIMIVKKHAQKVVKKLQNLKEMNENEKRSLKISINYLDKISKEKEVPIEENCQICGDKISYQTAKVFCCSNNHKFPRCCISLLPCDQFPYLSCQNCNTVALLEFGNQNNCLFCDGLLSMNVKQQCAR